MKRLAAALAIFAVVFSVLCISDVLSAETSDSEEQEFTDGCFTYAILQGTDVELVKYTEDKNNPLTTVEVPETVMWSDHQYEVVQISDGAFSDCQKVQTIMIPKSVRDITESAFSAQCISCFKVSSENSTYYATESDGILYEKGSNNLVRYPPSKAGESYTVTNNVSKIEPGAFAYSLYLKEVFIGENVLRLGDYAFSDCYKLETVSFSGSGLGIIGIGAFYNCTALKTINLPPELLTIGDLAFCSCKSLAEIEIPGSVISIGDGVFRHCESLAKFIVDEDNAKYTVYENALCVLDTQSKIKTLIAFPAACTLDNGADLVEYTIPSTINDILPYAFSDSHITKLCLPAGLSEIGAMAFAEMTSLTDVEIPKTVTKINLGAFTHCTSLKYIDTGVNTYQIEDMAFMGCTSLKEVVLHENLYSISDWAFSETAIESIVIPSSVGLLGASVFGHCENLTYIEIESKDVTATDTFDMKEMSQTVTVKCYDGALKDTGTVSDNVVFEYFDKKTFPMMNIVGIVACLLILFGILNFLRRI